MAGLVLPYGLIKGGIIPATYVDHELFTSAANQNNYLFNATLDALTNEIMIGIAATFDDDVQSSAASTQNTEIEGQPVLVEETASEYPSDKTGNSIGAGLSWIAGPVTNPQLSSGRSVGSTHDAASAAFVSVKNVSYVVDTDRAAGSGNALLSRNVNTEAGGFVIAAHAITGNWPIDSWSNNMTVMFNSVVNKVGFSVAYAEGVSAGSMNITAQGLGGDRSVLIIASFR